MPDKLLQNYTSELRNCMPKERNPIPQIRSIYNARVIPLSSSIQFLYLEVNASIHPPPTASNSSIHKVMPALTRGIEKKISKCLLNF